MVCSGPLSAANKSPSAAATQMQMLSPDSCDGGLEEGEEWPISMSFSRQEGSFQNYRMRRRTEHATWAEKDSCLETDPFNLKNPTNSSFQSETCWKVIVMSLQLWFSCVSPVCCPSADERARPPCADMWPSSFIQLHERCCVYWEKCCLNF